MKQYIEILQQSPLFDGIGPEELPDMLKCLSAACRSYQKNQTVFRMGEPATAVGVVCEGGVQVVQEDFMGNRTILSWQGKGDLFGEAFACAGIERLPVNVVAVAHSEIVLFNYRKIVTTCTSACAFHHRLIENMLKVLAKKNVLLNRKIEVLSKRSTREKLIHYLSEQARRAGSRKFMIPFNRQELADYLCVDRSAMSSELSKLQKEGVLTCFRSSFELAEPECME